MIAKIDLTKLGRNCAVAITQDGGTITQTYVEDSSNIEIGYNQINNTVTVTILGTISATTKDITTGTYLTMDTGSGAVTITSYATFKTNYSLLFLNGGSAPTPTLEQVLQAGNTSNTSSINLDNTTGLTAQMDFNNFALGDLDNIAGVGYYMNLTKNYLNFNKYLGPNLFYSSTLLPTDQNIGVSIENYLPVNSGTLLNGNMINGEGLQIEYVTGYYTLGNLNANKANFRIESLIDRAIINCEDLQFNGTNLISGSSSGNSGNHLVITLNGTSYKIALQNP